MRVGAGVDAEDLGLGQVHRADAEVGAGLLGALVGDQGGHRDQPVGAGAVAAGDLEGARVHRARCSARCPASVTRSRWRESSTTSRRAASSRSTVRTCSGSTWRTAAVSTAGRPAASARASRRAACERHPGVPSGPPWWTTSTASPSRGSSGLPRARGGARARSRRPASTARPDVGVGAEQHEQPARPALCAPAPLRRGGRVGRDPAAASFLTSCDLPTASVVPVLRKPWVSRTESEPSGWDQRASRSGLVTGTPRSPRRWVSVTRRHRAAQPTPGAVPPPRPRASTVTRGRRGSTIAPPRTGVRGRGRERTASGPLPGPTPGAGPAIATASGAGDERLDGEVDAEHRRDAGPPARRGEPDRAVEPVTVGERQRALAVVGGALDEVLGHRGAVAHREPRGDVEVGEPVHAALRPSGREPAAAAGARTARRGGVRRGRRRSRRRAAGRRPRGR